MPRPRNLFRLENVSKDSGLSFHCCGKPDDLLDEPLDFVNERRRTRKNAGPSKSEARTNERPLDSLLVATLRNGHRLARESKSTDVLPPSTTPTSSSSWSLPSFFFWSTTSRSNSKIKKFWCKKHVEPSIGTDKDSVLNANPGESGDPKQQLRSVRSMPLLSWPGKAASRQSRCRSRCLSPMSFAGLDRLIETKHEHEKSTRRDSEPQRPKLYETDHRTTHKDRAKVTSSKSHPTSSNLFPRPSKIYGILSMANWSHFFLNRHQKEEKSSQDDVHPTS